MCDPWRILQRGCPEYTGKLLSLSFSEEKKHVHSCMCTDIETTDKCIFFQIDKTVEFQASSLMSEVTVIVQDICSAKTPPEQKNYYSNNATFPRKTFGKQRVSPTWWCTQSNLPFAHNSLLFQTFLFPFQRPKPEIKLNQGITLHRYVVHIMWFNWTTCIQFLINTIGFILCILSTLGLFLRGSKYSISGLLRTLQSSGFFI